jgi:hypothetical protein
MIGLRPPPDDVGRQKGCKVRIARDSLGIRKIGSPVFVERSGSDLAIYRQLRIQGWVRFEGDNDVVPSSKRKGGRLVLLGLRKSVSFETPNHLQNVYRTL